jgi:DNA-binding CsgD family transcriptional regulator
VPARTPRFTVLEDADPVTVRAAAAERDAPVVTGWTDPAPPGAVRLGGVADAADAAKAVLAAVQGVDLVIVATAPREVIDQLCDDLRRLGRLDHRVGPAAPSAPAVALGPDERALLGRLIGGASLGEAARALHLSRRTADRRLAAARRALGAATTSEALVLAQRIGVTAAG